MIEINKTKFLENEIWGLSFNGAFQHAGVYKKVVTEKAKTQFRNAIREKISFILDREGYAVRTPSSEEHIKIIEEIKKWIDSKFASILSKDEVNIGIVQKLVNLHLKYRWCLGWAKTPPHCPFDSIIISKLGFKYSDIPSFTKIKKIEIYMDLVKRAEKIASGYENIASWELDVFSRRVNRI